MYRRRAKSAGLAAVRGDDRVRTGRPAGRGPDKSGSGRDHDPNWRQAAVRDPVLAVSVLSLFVCVPLELYVAMACRGTAPTSRVRAAPPPR